MSSICKTCFSPVDMRTDVICSDCKKPLHKDCAINDGGTFLCDVCYTVKQEGGSSMTTENLTIPDVIRRSYIETYKQCPYSFYLTVVKGIETEASSFAQIGIDLHEYFHRACLGQFPSAEIMINSYKSMFEAYDDKIFKADLHLYKDMTLDKFKKKMWQQSLDAIDTFFT